MLAMMLYALVTSALLAVAARAGEEVLQSSRRPIRGLWVAALLGSIGLPVLAWLSGGAWPGGLLPYRDAWRLELLEVATSPVGHPATALITSPETSAAVWQSWLFAGWLAASLIAAVVYGGAWAKLARRRRSWRSAELAGTRVAVSSGDGPLVQGLRRPTIVVPSWLLDEAPESQRMVLLHEAEHVRARDHALLALAPVVAIVMPWNLPVWWQLARLRLAVELDCDRRVLTRGVTAAAYGSVLLDVAGRSRGGLAAAPALAEPRTFLERRILAMTQLRRSQDWRRVAGFAGLAALAVLLACETAGPVGVNAVSPQSVVIRPTTASDGASSADPVMILDGVVIRKAELEALDVDWIDHIEVMKGATAVLSPAEREQLGAATAPAGVIRITTKSAAPVPARSSNIVRQERSIEPVQVVPLMRERAESQPARLRPSRVLESYPGDVIEQNPAVEIDGRPGTIRLLRELHPDEIANIEIIKPPLSARLFGDRARDGLIRVTTKRPR